MWPARWRHWRSPPRPAGSAWSRTPSPARACRRDGTGSAPVRADGRYAGSALRMDSAVANLVAAGIGLTDVVAAATRIPADLIGRGDLGRIAPGAAADLVWLGDDLRARAAWVGGRQAHGPGPRARRGGR